MLKHCSCLNIQTPLPQGKITAFLFTLTFLQSFLQLFSLNLLLIYIVQKIISPNTKTRAQDNHISTTLSSQVCLFVFSVICYSGLLHTIRSEVELANFMLISQLYGFLYIIIVIIILKGTHTAWKRYVILAMTLSK